MIDVRPVQQAGSKGDVTDDVELSLSKVDVVLNFAVEVCVSSCLRNSMLRCFLSGSDCQLAKISE